MKKSKNDKNKGFDKNMYSLDKEDYSDDEPAEPKKDNK